MPQNQSVQILCRYRLKPDKAKEFEALLHDHWKMLSDLGLTTTKPAQLERASDKAGNVAYFERFAWRNPAAVDSAHQSPEVMRFWEPMGALCEDMEFWNIEPVD